MRRGVAALLGGGLDLIKSHEAFCSSDITHGEMSLGEKRASLWVGPTVPKSRSV